MVTNMHRWTLKHKIAHLYLECVFNDNQRIWNLDLNFFITIGSRVTVENNSFQLSILSAFFQGIR